MPVTETLDVVSYLASKGYQGRRANGPEVAYPCFFACDEAPTSRKRKLYVNTEEGYYDCKVCGASGGTYLLQTHFGDDPKGDKKLSVSDTQLKREILGWAAEVGSAMLGNNDEMMLYLLNERGLSPETIVEAKLGYIGNNWSLIDSLPKQYSKDEFKDTGLVYRDGPRAGQDFFYNHILIPYVHRGGVQQIRGKVHGAKYFTGPGEPVRMYGLDDLDDAEDVIITEGEFDCLALRQHLRSSPDDRVRKIAVVGLAGANGFKDGFETYFANAKRVFVGLDPDDTGKRYAVAIKEKLGARARILELPAELPKCDWTEYLLPVPPDADGNWHRVHPHAGHTWRDVVSLLGNAAGKRLHSMRESGVAFHTQRDGIEGIKTGFEGLDATILPGLLPGQVMVVLAKTGTGKTVLCCNLAYQMRMHPTLLISLELTREEVYNILRRVYWFFHPTATREQMEEDLDNILICDENRLTDADFQALVDEYEVEKGVRPKVVFVDYLGYYARGAEGKSPYEKTTNAIMNLKALAKCDDPTKRLTIITPHQVNRLAKEGKPIDLDDARDSGAVEETADFMLSIWKPDEALNSDGEAMPSGRVRMTLLKSRHGGKGRSFLLTFDQLTLAMVDADTAKGRKAQEHTSMYNRGDTWEILRAIETAPTQQAFAYSPGRP